MIFRLPELFHPHMADPGPEETGKKASLDLRTLEPLADLDKPDAQFVLCRGGRGGKGNTHFKSSPNRAPRRTTDGESGEEGWFALELRTIRRGVVGYPNAGKSIPPRENFAARPKAALHAHIDPSSALNWAVIAARRCGGPGLIEGAIITRASGTNFAYIERCKLLLFVIDMAGSEARDPMRTSNLAEELKRATLRWLPDLRRGRQQDGSARSGQPPAAVQGEPKATVLPVCANKGEGIDQLRSFRQGPRPKTS
jgi:GTP-binding protein